MDEPFNPYQSWLGISIDDGIVDHYRLLDLPYFESDPGRIEGAAETQMNRVRKHQTGPRGELTQVLLKQIVEAKLCLLDSSSKQQYDRTLQANLAAASAEPISAESIPAGSIHVDLKDGEAPKNLARGRQESESRTEMQIREQNFTPDSIGQIPARKTWWFELIILAVLLLLFSALAVFVVWIASR